jgi:hypothetical protein
MKESRKTAYDTTIGKSVRAAVLIYKGEFAGKILAVWGREGQCRCTVGVWAGPLKEFGGTETAGGGGYDKYGSCLAGIFESYKVELTDPYNGGNNKTTLSRILDGGSYDRAFKAAGYQYYQVA